MSYVLKIKSGNTWTGIPAIKGEPGGVTQPIADALLHCFENVGWKGIDGQEYIDRLQAALNPPASISAVYTQVGTVFDTDSIDVLRGDLVVTATYGDSTQETVSAYDLSGTLSPGSSTITVTYGGVTTTFSVPVLKNDPDDWDFYWTYRDGDPLYQGFDRTTGGGTTWTASMHDAGFYLGANSGINVRYNALGLPAQILANGSIGIVEAVVKVPEFTGTANLFFPMVSISDGSKGVKIGFYKAAGENGTKYIKLIDNSTLASGTNIKTGWDYNKDYTIRLEMDGTYGKVYLDGTLLAENIDYSTFAAKPTVCGVSAQNGDKNNGFYWRVFKCKYTSEESEVGE